MKAADKKVNIIKRYDRELKFIFITFLIMLSSRGFCCDMMALIAVDGQTISGMEQNPGSHDDPCDYFDFLKERSNSYLNNDGYGIIYYRDGNPWLDPDQCWYKTGFNCWYGDGDEEPLDTAIDLIMNDDNDAVIVLGHDREASGGYGSHPFRFLWHNRVYTFMHNGTVRESVKVELMNHLGEEWFMEHPSNWQGEFGDPSSFIDSEILFHYIMNRIIAEDEDVITGIYSALNDQNVNGIDLRQEFSGYYSVINFVLSDGEHLYVFRNYPANPNRNLCYEIHESGFIGIQSTGDLPNQIDPNSMVVFSRDLEPEPHSFFSADFSALPMNGIVPLTVNFQDESAGEQICWKWDFQNDGCYDSYDQNPTFVYDLPGVYDVKLTISDGSVQDSLVIFNCITVSDDQNPDDLFPGIFWNYPNPFNGQTIINFMPEEDCLGKLTVYNLKGEKVICLYRDRELLSDNSNPAFWDGRDYAGKQLSSGIYIYRIETKDGTIAKKMVLVE